MRLSESPALPLKRPAPPPVVPKIATPFIEKVPSLTPMAFSPNGPSIPAQGLVLEQLVPRIRLSSLASPVERTIVASPGVVSTPSKIAESKTIVSASVVSASSALANAPRRLQSPAVPVHAVRAPLSDVVSTTKKSSSACATAGAIASVAATTTATTALLI